MSLSASLNEAMEKTKDRSGVEMKADEGKHGACLLERRESSRTVWRGGS